MSEAADAIMAAIHSAFDSYPKEGDPEWRSPNWIMPEDCALFDWNLPSERRRLDR